ncbi:hypothetical protein KPH14_007822 [Odynerus spinipes]|uniref:DRBM domain-containing protein n=1 Tax=Odynerus spinipes TaxID=1348599 RepID=A0AAD9VXJ2_9HYME|nr:hypothetical protein KPH14_007822 [Odynerus spinipes]
MILQELGVKECVLPSYDVIYSKNGTHENVFTYKVKYKDLCTDGTASNKKEAKQNAAQNMLKLLQQSNNLSSKELKILSSSESNVFTTKSMSCSSTSLFPESRNYVGTLQEYCIKNNLIEPNYELCETNGLPHQMTFTVSCTLGSITEKAVANTKKQAKQQVAQKVLQNLPNIKNITNSTQCQPLLDNRSNKQISQDILEELGLRIANLKMIDSTSSRDIKLKFINATTERYFKSLLQLDDKIAVNNYHLYFKSIIYNRVCNNKEKELALLYKTLNTHVEKYRSIEKYNENNLLIHKQILEYIKEKLNFTVQRITLANKISPMIIIGFRADLLIPLTQFAIRMSLFRLCSCVAAPGRVRQLYLRLIHSGKVLDTFTAKNTIKCNYTRWAHRRPVAIVNEDELFDDQNENDKIIQHKKIQHANVRKVVQSKQTFTQSQENCTDKIVNKKSDNSSINELAKRTISLTENDNVITSTMMNVKSRKMREKSNQILLEGHRQVKDAIEAGVKPQIIFFNRISDIIDLPLHEELKLYKVPYKVMQLWSNLTTSPGIIGIFDIPDMESKQPAPNALPLTIICDNIRDPGNLGSILRTAAGVGCEKLVLMKGCVDLWDPKVLRSGAGAHFRLPIYTSIDEELSSFINDGMDIFVTDNNVTNNTNNIFDNFNSEMKYTISKIYENVKLENMELPELQGHQSKEMKKIVKTLQSQFPVVPYYAIDYSMSEIALVISGETEGLSLELLKLLQGKRPVRVNVPLTNGVESLNVELPRISSAEEKNKQREDDFCLKEEERKMWAGEDQTQRYKTRVLKPPGGGSSDIFGSTQDETSPRRVKNHNQSQLGSALFGDAPDSSSNSNNGASGNGENNGGETPRSGKPDGNPVTGTGYTSETQNGGSAVQNGTGSSSSSIGEKSNGSSPTGKPAAGTRTRVPPGGYSSGLW